jgi:hypothetical protein
LVKTVWRFVTKNLRSHRAKRNDSERRRNWLSTASGGIGTRSGMNGWFSLR